MSEKEEPTYDKTAIEMLDLMPERRRPWKLLMTSTSEMPALSAKTNKALAHIFDLFPQLTVLTVKTTAGDLRVTRDFPSGYTQRVDDMIATIFANEPTVTGLIFPATATRPGHTATRDDPHWSHDGKALAAIDADCAAGRISPEEAIRKIKELDSWPDVNEG